MPDPKIISELPMDVSVRWARDQEELQSARPFVSDAREISQVTARDVSSPVSFSYLALLVGAENTSSTWAVFTPPSGFYTQNKQTFTPLGLVSLVASQEHVDNTLAKIRSVTDSDQATGATFCHMLEMLASRNNDLHFMLSNRTRHQKG